MLYSMRLLVAIALTASVSIPNAAADGETSPMLGGALVAGASTEPSASMAGVEIDVAMWWRWLGVAVETSARAPVEDNAGRTVVLGGSLRLRLMQVLVPSLFEPSDVELAVELQGIVEQTVWEGTLTDREPYRRGVGIALRLRGSTEDYAPRLITESRFFIRALWWRQPGEDHVARTTLPPATETRELIILFGVGAAFGGGEPRYLQQFRRRPFDSIMLRPLGP